MALNTALALIRAVNSDENGISSVPFFNPVMSTRMDNSVLANSRQHFPVLVIFAGYEKINFSRMCWQAFPELRNLLRTSSTRNGVFHTAVPSLRDRNGQDAAARRRTTGGVYKSDGVLVETCQLGCRRLNFLVCSVRRLTLLFSICTTFRHFRKNFPPPIDLDADRSLERPPSISAIVRHWSLIFETVSIFCACVCLCADGDKQKQRIFFLLQAVFFWFGFVNVCLSKSIKRRPCDCQPCDNGTVGWNHRPTSGGSSATRSSVKFSTGACEAVDSQLVQVKRIAPPSPQKGRLMGHRLGRLVTWAALISCVSIYLLLEQLSRVHWSGHCSSAGSGSSESTNCQRHQRNLMMAGEDMAEHHQAAQPLPPDLNGNVSTLGLKAPLQQHLPQLLIIGVRKGGTRALLEMLNLHPAVCMVPVEVHFFDKSDNYQKGLEWYRSQMPLSRADQLTVEKSPSYFVTPEVPERVWAMNPATKLILIVRDPVVRLLSDFAQIEETRLSHGLPTRRFQDVALLSSGEVNTQYRALHISLYAKFLSRWLHVFPRRQLHVVDGDQLVKYPWPEIERVERFLELEPLIRPDQFYFNATKGFYCLREANNSHKCLADTKGRRHPKVPEEVISQLRQFFAPHNRKFFAMVGQQFDWPEQ